MGMNSFWWCNFYQGRTGVRCCLDWIAGESALCLCLDDLRPNLSVQFDLELIERESILQNLCMPT